MTRATSLWPAAAVAFLIDLAHIGHASRDQESSPGHPPVMVVCALCALVLVHALRNFGERLTFVIAAVIWGGMALAHTMRLIAELSGDPASHRLWPFESMLLFVLVVMPLIGAATGHFRVKS